MASPRFIYGLGLHTEHEDGLHKKSEPATGSGVMVILIPSGIGFMVFSKKKALSGKDPKEPVRFQLGKGDQSRTHLSHDHEAGAGISTWHGKTTGC